MSIYLKLTGWLLLLLIAATIPFCVLDRAEQSASAPPESEPFPSPDVPPNLPEIEETPTLTLAEEIVTETKSEMERLVQLHHLTSNVLLLNKGTDTRHYATNEDLVQLLLGRNINQTAYLSKESALVNEDGQLVDLNGQPIIVHIESSDNFTLKSAGPDQIPYTDDDLTWPPAPSTE